MSLREDVLEVIQREGLDTDSGGAVVYGYALVVEWSAPDGERWLSSVSSDPTGKQELPEWQKTGYYYNDWDEDTLVEPELEEDE